MFELTTDAKSLQQLLLEEEEHNRELYQAASAIRFTDTEKLIAEGYRDVIIKYILQSPTLRYIPWLLHNLASDPTLRAALMDGVLKQASAGALECILFLSELNESEQGLIDTFVGIKESPTEFRIELLTSDLEFLQATRRKLVEDSSENPEIRLAAFSGFCLPCLRDDDWGYDFDDYEDFEEEESSSAPPAAEEILTLAKHLLRELPEKNKEVLSLLAKLQEHQLLDVFTMLLTPSCE